MKKKWVILKNIYFVTETYPPDINGVSLTLEKIVTGFTRKNYHVTVVVPDTKHSTGTTVVGKNLNFLPVKGIPIPLYSELKMGLPCYGYLRKIWSNRKPDLVHIATEGPLGLSALFAAKKLSIPLISDFRTNFHEYGKYYGIGIFGKSIFSYLRYFHNNTNKTLVPTQSLFEFLSAKKIKNISVIPRGVDVKKFNPILRCKKTRSEIGISDSCLTILSVSRLAREKNLDLVVDCFYELKKMYGQIQLIFVGSGPYMNKLKKRCPDASFVGYKTGVELSKYYANADLMVFPSLTETFGNVTLEALASGLPVLCYDTAAAKELVIDGENGFTVSPFQKEAFLRKATQIFDQVNLGNVRINARKTAEKNCWDNVINKTEKEFLNVFENSKTIYRTFAS